ncbi:hypothetical protein [Roseateles sp.]|uniref:hypothetical protein n=1 Tax=Roseateles sp. TaxID=1971397 RepID=UPI00392AB54A
MHTRERLARSSNGLPSLAAWALSAALAVPTPAEAGSTSVRAQIDINEVPDVLVLASKTAASFAEVGTLGDLYAKARVSYGNNGAYAMASHLPARFGAYAESIWMDGFTIDGPGGTGLLEVHVHVHGTLDDLGAPGSHGPNAFYQLFVSDTPMSCDFDGLSCNGSLAIPMVEAINGSRTLTAALPFTYGKTFYLASFLGAEVLGEGEANFYGSAHFGATAPGGAALVGESGTTYALASSVPEPTPAALLALGLAGCLLWSGGPLKRPGAALRSAPAERA